MFHGILFDELCTGPEKLFIPANGKTPSKRHAQIPLFLPTARQSKDVEYDSIQEIVRVSVLGCDIDCRREIMSNVVLVGGGLVDGVQQRLADELKTVFPESMKM